MPQWCVQGNREAEEVLNEEVLVVFILAPNYEKAMNSARVNRRLVWCPRYELNVRPAV
jgi:hypothetical protein